MNRFALLSAATVAALLGTSVAHADLLVGSAGDGWQAFPTTLNNYTVVKGIPVGDPNRPFWDNPSSDVPTASKGGPLNIGNYLVTPSNQRFITTRVNVPGAGLVAPQWWGSTGSSSNSNNLDFDPNTYFTRGDSVGAITAQMLLQSAGGANKTIVGWYDIDNPSDMHVIWNGKNINNDEVTFTPTENWGFYLKNSSGQIFYMDSSLNTVDQGDQHFAIFQEPGGTLGAEIYYVGIEDTAYGTPVPEGNGDFNDFVLKFWSSTAGRHIPPTPEPASLMFLGTGALGLLVRRKK
ncbi:MAG: PEP-CTERM sorting domain-containing protein [Phycisphaerales bacterium]|nr:PEP-CTERM sorting domain-containing protein [Phycisphaerales bacterium]